MLDTESDWTEDDIKDDEIIDLIREGSNTGYMLEILRNKLMISEFWQGKFPRLYPQEEEASRTAKILHRAKNKGIINPETWLANPKAVPDHELHAFAKVVQIESVAIYSANILEILMRELEVIQENPTEFNNKHETFRQCIMAESFLAPICKVIGLHRLSDAILNVSGKIRFTAGGRNDLLEKAQKKIDSLGSSNELEHFTADIVREFGGELEDFNNVIANEQNYNLFSREMRFLDEDGKEVRSLMRRKTTASLARKMLDGHEVNDILDLFGFTFITDEDDPDIGDEHVKYNPPKADKFEQLKRVSRKLVHAATNSESFELVPSTSRKHLGEFGGIHIRGVKRFTDQIKKAISSVLGKDTNKIDINNERSKHEDDFHVVKVTGRYTGENGKIIPIEIQCQTQLQRQSAIAGKGNHSHYKIMKYANNKGIKNDPEGSMSMRSRRHGMITPQLHKNVDKVVSREFVRKILSPAAEFVGDVAVKSCDEARFT